MSEPRKIAIVGFAKPHRADAPFDDPGWDIWGVNDAWSFIPRAERWFEIHAPWIYTWRLRRAHGHEEFLASFPGPVYMLDHYDEFPTSVPFPIAEVTADLGRVYLTSTIAYMLALAVCERPAEIGIWGVDMASMSEYADQRPCCEWLIGVAEGRGIKVTLPEKAGLMRGQLYGRGWMNEGGERITTSQMEDRLRLLLKQEQVILKQLEEQRGKLNLLQGALTETRYWLTKCATQPEYVTRYKDRADKLTAHEPELMGQVDELLEYLFKVRGQITETKFWIGSTPEGGDPRLLGGAATLQAPPLVVTPPSNGVVSDDDPLAVMQAQGLVVRREN